MRAETWGEVGRTQGSKLLLPSGAQMPIPNSRVSISRRVQSLRRDLFSSMLLILTVLREPQESTQDGMRRMHQSLPV
jgi:hypothetical protein